MKLKCFSNVWAFINKLKHNSVYMISTRYYVTPPSIERLNSEV